MATATKLRSEEKQGTWANVFPTEQVTAQQSALFVKKLLAVAVSSITYLRDIFPEHAFGDRCLEDLNLKVLRDDSSCPAACQVIKWLKGCFDAIDKKYLRVLVIGIYTDPDDPDTVIESYSFKFSYSKDGGVDIYRNGKRLASAHSAVETRKATMRLLRTIVVLTQSLQSLPDSVLMTVKLLYYDDVTPGDYEPPGFAAAASEIFKYDDEPMNIKVGAVATPFHTVKLRIKTDAKQFEDMEEDQEPAEEEMEDKKEVQLYGLDEESVAVDYQDLASRRQRGTKEHEPMEGDSVPNATPARPGVDDQAVSTTGSQASSAAAGHDEQAVRCPCGYDEDDGLMVLCAHCKYWQHGVCFSITQEAHAPERHICSYCANVDIPDLAPTDPSLYDSTQVAIQATCLWRRALAACSETDRIVHTSLARRLSVEMTVASGLVHRLEKEGFLKRGRSKALGKMVDKEKLQEGFKKYLQPPSREPTVAKAASVKESDQDIPKESNKNAPRGKKAKKIDSDIEKLANITQEMNITGQRKQKNQIQESKPAAESLKGRKRVKARSGEAHEFELSPNSSAADFQEPEWKRRKASIASKPIKV